MLRALGKPDPNERSDSNNLWPTSKVALNELFFCISQAVKSFIEFPGYTPKLPQPLSFIAVGPAQGLDERRALLQRISCEALLPRLDAIPVDGR